MKVTVLPPSLPRAVSSAAAGRIGLQRRGAGARAACFPSPLTMTRFHLVATSGRQRGPAAELRTNGALAGESGSASCSRWQRSPTVDGSAGNRMRILLIEDNAKLAASTKASLEEHGYCVDVATTARQGDELALVENYDVIVLDVVLPDGNGLALCNQLRRQKVTTPILMLSVLAATSDKVAGLDAGADDYLTKPFQFDELLARVRSLWRRAQATDGATLRSGDLVMNLHEHRVFLDGKAIKLSAKEYALLEYMMRNPRKLLTRSMISESVWDMNHESSSNVIDVYVSSLRRKVDRGSRERRIETVIGSGYRFVDSPLLEEERARTAPRS